MAEGRGHDERPAWHQDGRAGVAVLTAASRREVCEVNSQASWGRGRSIGWRSGDLGTCPSFATMWPGVLGQVSFLIGAPISFRMRVQFVVYNLCSAKPFRD